MNLVPLYDQILVRRDDGSTQVGSIIIPESAKDKPNTGIVIACGEGRLCPELKNMYGRTGAHVEPLRVKVGQRVYFQSYAGTELEDKSTTPPTVLLLMSEDDVLAIVKDPSNDRSASSSRSSAQDQTEENKAEETEDDGN